MMTTDSPTQPKAEEAVEESAVAAESVPAGTEEVEVPIEDQTFSLTVRLPESTTQPIKLYVSSQTAIQDIRQAIFDVPDASGYTCFYLTFNGQKLSDFTELGEIEDFTPDSELELHEDAYNDRELRVHLTRFRETMTLFNSHQLNRGVDYASSYLGHVDRWDDSENLNVNGKGKKKARTEKNTKPGTRATDDLHAFDDYDFECTGHNLLSDFVVEYTDEAERLKPVKSFSMSAWNPVPHSQRSAGDLLYLRVQTLESEVLHITCSTFGFFINGSTDTHFDPAPREVKSYHEHNLAVTLSKASPQFAKTFAKLQNKVAQRNPLEYLHTVEAVYPWAVRSRKVAADEGRTLDMHLHATDQADGFGSHDWNEELQSIRELPHGTPHEKVHRDQALYRIHSEFIEAASRGAVAVLTGNAIPLNPQEPTATQMFLHNNIFYSVGYDNREVFDRIGGEAAAHVAVSKDVDGVRLLNNLEIPDLFTVGTAVIDYQGHRVVAQSVIPGILRRAPDADPLVKYGSVDMGNEIAADPEFHVMSEKIAKALHLGEHTVVDGAGKEWKLHTSLETKGIVGQDDRKYFLDLFRVTPVDVEFLEEIDGKKDTDGEKEVPEKSEDGEEKNDKADKSGLPEYPHRLVLMRPELLDHFYEHKLRAAMAEAKTKEGKGEEKKNEEEEASKESAGELTKKATKENATETTETSDEAKEKPAVENGDRKQAEPADDVDSAISQTISQFKLSLNPDVFTPIQQGDAPEVKAAHENAVRDVALFLRKTMLQRLVIECVYHAQLTDSEALTKRFHSRGINMRYLGKAVEVAQEVGSVTKAATNADGAVSPLKHNAYFIRVCKQEMVGRAAKHILRNMLKESPGHAMRECVAKFLSCLFADEDVEINFEYKASQGRKIGLKAKSQPELPFASLTPASVHADIRHEVAKRYRFTDLSATFWRERPLALLRSICIKVGLQIEALDYFAGSPSSTTPLFNPSNIITHLPVIKHHPPRATFAEETLESANYTLNTHPALAIELYTEAATVYEQIYGPVHADTARAYTALALAYHQTGDIDKAVGWARKAVVVGERCLGVDCEEVVGWYANLAYFEYVRANSELVDVADEEGAPKLPPKSDGELAREKRVRDERIARALRLMRHALRMWEKIAAGERNLEGASTDSNLSTILSDINPSVSLQFLLRALDTHTTLLGKSHALTLKSQESLVKHYIQIGDFHQAVTAQRIVCEILRARHVPAATKGDSEEVKDGNDAAAAAVAAEMDREEEKLRTAEAILAGLTARAVSEARKAALLKSSAKSSRVGNGVTLEPSFSNGQGTNGTAEKKKKKKDKEPSIDQLLEFIGEKKQAPAAQPGKKAGGKKPVAANGATAAAKK
ncbi:clustered mitochondria-domain-containing protein [Fimicolochytrium jonesii]|uniref:clustered mitochondria-domain-containing protein n=1 Tax=Fimicolochytrium jonesii TaxID=1396493 RepID=UPI0022FE5105|nr:clustered mitochondria-domain-containing protein [Fimicolochytrium jonesii]KAI8821824.1 clustered mitochondria-domain-containing protein [Fimicolochytrium jonesii]